MPRADLGAGERLAVEGDGETEARAGAGGEGIGLRGDFETLAGADGVGGVGFVADADERLDAAQVAFAAGLVFLFGGLARGVDEFETVGVEVTEKFIGREGDGPGAGIFGDEVGAGLGEGNREGVKPGDGGDARDEIDGAGGGVVAEGGDFLGGEGTDDAGEILADVEGERERGVGRDEELVGSEPELMGGERGSEGEEAGEEAVELHGGLI